MAKDWRKDDDEDVRINPDKFYSDDEDDEEVEYVVKKSSSSLGGNIDDSGKVENSDDDYEEGEIEERTNGYYECIDGEMVYARYPGSNTKGSSSSEKAESGSSAIGVIPHAPVRSSSSMSEKPKEPTGEEAGTLTLSASQTYVGMGVTVTVSEMKPANNTLDVEVYLDDELLNSSKNRWHSLPLNINIPGKLLDSEGERMVRVLINTVEVASSTITVLALPENALLLSEKVSSYDQGREYTLYGNCGSLYFQSSCGPTSALINGEETELSYFTSFFDFESGITTFEIPSEASCVPIIKCISLGSTYIY